MIVEHEEIIIEVYDDEIIYNRNDINYIINVDTREMTIEEIKMCVDIDEEAQAGF
jgi:hypothetical protein